MTQNILELAEADGFKKGWQDGLSGAPAMPCPNIGFNLFEPGYMKHFNAAYYDAYETAREENRRQEMREVHQNREHLEDRER